MLEAKDKLTAIKLSAPERGEYKIYLDNLRYQASMVRSNYDSGIIDGEKIGIKKGIEKTKIETAKKMKQAGISAELIRQITGVSIDE